MTTKKGSPAGKPVQKAPQPASVPTPAPIGKPKATEAPKVCIACGGKGKNTKGHTCPICNGTGKPKGSVPAQPPVAAKPTAPPATKKEVAPDPAPAPEPQAKAVAVKGDFWKKIEAHDDRLSEAFGPEGITKELAELLTQWDDGFAAKSLTIKSAVEIAKKLKALVEKQLTLIT